MKCTPASVRPLALLLLGSTMGCAVPQLSVAPMYGSLSLDGDFLASDPTAMTPSTLGSDLETMGLDDSETVPGLRADLKLGAPHIILYGSQASFSGRGRVGGEIQLENLVIPANENVDTDFDLAQYTGLVMFDVLPTKSFDLGIGAGVTLLDFDLELESLGPMATGTMVETDETLPVPVLAANAGINIGPIDVGGLVSGLSLSTGDAEGTLIDGDAYVRWKFFGGKNHARAALLLGWRQTELDFEYDDGDDKIEADLSLTGPYLSLQFTL